MTLPLRERIDMRDVVHQAIDPGIRDSLHEEAPPAAEPTHGPQTLTFYVPQYETKLSLGQSRDPWRTSAGIVGSTGPNVYFETTDAPKTAVSLGTAGKGSDFIGQGITGYMMRTQGRAFRHADKQFYVTSIAGDVIFHAKKNDVLFQSDAGQVQVNGGQDISIRSKGEVAITAEHLEPYDTKYAEHFVVQEGPAEFNFKTGRKWANQLLKYGKLVMQFIPIKKTGKPMEPGVADFKVNKEKVAFAVGKTLAGFFYSKIFDSKGDVNVQGAHDVSMYAGQTAWMNSNLKADVSSGFAAAIIAPVAVINSPAHASVWGGGWGCIDGLKKVTIAAKKKDLGITSRNRTELHAHHHLYMVSHKTAQLNAEKGHVTVAGHSAFVGAASTYGFIADHHGAYFGNVGDATDFKSPKLDQHPYVKVTSSEMEAAFDADHSLKMSAMGATLKHKSGEIDIGPIGVWGKAAGGPVEFKPS